MNLDLFILKLSYEILKSSLSISIVEAFYLGMCNDPFLDLSVAFYSLRVLILEVRLSPSNSMVWIGLQCKNYAITHSKHLETYTIPCYSASGYAIAQHPNWQSCVKWQHAIVHLKTLGSLLLRQCTIAHCAVLQWKALCVNSSFDRFQLPPGPLAPNNHQINTK